MTPAERLSGRIPSAADIEGIARATLDRLPPQFSQSLGDVVLVIEEVADNETARRLGLRHPMQLSGLYEGVPLTRRVSYSGAMPDRITIYQNAICRACWTEDQVREQVRQTVIHEIGHYFGIDDPRLRELGH